MDLLDINVLIYAHREDAPRHDEYAEWLTQLASGQQRSESSLALDTGQSCST